VLKEKAMYGTIQLWQYIQENNYVCPLIHSQWYVDWLPDVPPEIKEFEQEKRELGRKILEALEVTAANNLELYPTSKRETIALILLDFADWIGTQPGYGNMLIFSRCQDMATVPIAHLIADLEYPEEKLVEMCNRLLLYPEDTKKFVAALNEESPSDHFVAEEGTDIDSVIVPLEETWRKGKRKVHEWKKNNINLATSELSQEYSFFIDDEYQNSPKPFTFLQQWDYKYHERLILGLGGFNISYAKDFLLFRETIGLFPTEPPSWWEPGDSVFPTPIHASFRKVWEPYMVEYGPIYSAAAYVYNSVKSNTFYDEDLKRKNLYEKKSEMDAKIGIR